MWDASAQHNDSDEKDTSCFNSVLVNTVQALEDSGMFSTSYRFFDTSEQL